MRNKRDGFIILLYILWYKSEYSLNEFVYLYAKVYS